MPAPDYSLTTGLSNLNPPLSPMVYNQPTDEDGALLWAKKDFANSILWAAQDMNSDLLGIVKPETIDGEELALDGMEPTRMQRRTTRYGDTVITPQEYTRRWLHPYKFDVADYVEQDDIMTMLHDPESAIAMNFGWAAGREMKYEILRSFWRGVKTGHDGETTLNWNPDAAGATNVGQYIGGASQPFDVEFLRKASKAMDNLKTRGRRYCIFTTEEKHTLLTQTEVTNSDYNSVKALVNGEVNSFMGFTFIELYKGALPDANNTGAGRSHVGDTSGDQSVAVDDNNWGDFFDGQSGTRNDNGFGAGQLDHRKVIFCTEEAVSFAAPVVNRINTGVDVRKNFMILLQAVAIMGGARRFDNEFLEGRVSTTGVTSGGLVFQTQ